ncbi:outer membrane lipoprotein-sorting protein [Desulfonema ishimotonii]|uniref:outer membrane lipoprotein-sorting protein n=1 Tax=Desulfonema ishimotonii TaxID=45657 RepID=UPI000F56062F|nr:outer membrane lipoprotein-sorting protein [Desulfonema ishimotonii]
MFARYKQQEKKLETLTETMVLVQKMVSEGMEAEVTLYKKGDKSRVETIIKKSANPMMGKAGMKNIVIDDGTSSWIFNPMTGKMKEPNDPDEAEERTPEKVAYLTEETVATMKCHKIKASYPDGEYEILWIGADNDVLVKQEYFDGEGRETTTNSDFRTVEGVIFPWKMVTESDGMVQQMTVTSLKINTDVPDSLFDPSQVEGYADASPEHQKAAQQVDKMMEVMNLVTEIQELHQRGEHKKAEILEKKMQQMMQSR